MSILVSYLHSQLCHYSVINIHSDLLQLAVLIWHNLYICKTCSFDLYPQNWCPPAPYISYEDKAVVTMYNDIYTVYRSGCGCESRAEQIVYYDDSDVTGAWPMRVLSSNLCVTRENASNNSPVCHRKPLLSPHNPLQQPNTNLSIWYNHQDIYQQYCKSMQPQAYKVLSTCNC